MPQPGFLNEACLEGGSQICNCIAKQSASFWTMLSRRGSAAWRTFIIHSFLLKKDAQQLDCSKVPSPAPALSRSCGSESGAVTLGRAAQTWLYCLPGCSQAAASTIRRALPAVPPTCFCSQSLLCFFLLSLVIIQLSLELLLCSHPLRGRKRWSVFSGRDSDWETCA